MTKKLNNSAIRSLHLTDKTWKQLNDDKRDNDLDWEHYIGLLLRVSEDRNFLLSQLDAQAQRIGKTRGQLIRMLSALMNLEELCFVRLERNAYDDLRQLSDGAGKTCAEFLINLIHNEDDANEE